MGIFRRLFAGTRIVLLMHILSISAAGAQTDETKTLPTVDESIVAPRSDSLFMMLGAALIMPRQQTIPSAQLLAGIFLRDFFLIRGELDFPLANVDAEIKAEKTSRKLPFILRGGGAFHLPLWKRLAFAIPLLAGFEVNRNADELRAVQTFVEIGAGASVYAGGVYMLQVEYRYHFSNVPLASGVILENNYHVAAMSAGIFF